MMASSTCGGRGRVSRVTVQRSVTSSRRRAVALALLEDPSALERSLLGAFPYQRNEAVLHTDSSLLPRRTPARQAWNYHLFAQPRTATTVTYYLNHLQRLDAPDRA